MILFQNLKIELRTVSHIGEMMVCMLNTVPSGLQKCYKFINNRHVKHLNETAHTTDIKF